MKPRHALVPDESQEDALQRAMRAFARWRNARRGESGAVWEHGDVPRVVHGRKYERKTLHYTYLNPCESGLVDDPLAWPFSSYRDALGLALPAIQASVRSPEALHARVTATLSTTRKISPLPRVGYGALCPELRRLLGAVSSLTRTPPPLLARPGAARRLFLRAARELAGATSDDVGALLGLRPPSVRDAWREQVRGVGLVARVVDDPRFGMLVEGDLRRLATWRRYVHHV